MNNTVTLVKYTLMLISKINYSTHRELLVQCGMQILNLFMRRKYVVVYDEAQNICTKRVRDGFYHGSLACYVFYMAILGLDFTQSNNCC
jgi:hypothetical protein